MKTTRINTGLYQFTHKGRTFQVEDIRQASDGDCQPGWMVYEMKGDNREYMNDYGTKGHAVRATVAGLDEEA